MTHDIYAQRLLKLADTVESVAPNRFNFRSWVGSDWGGKPDLSCGTTACALGWGTTVPEFRALGLRLYQDDQKSYTWVGLEGSTDDTAEHASNVIFGTSIEEFEFLFIPIEDLCDSSHDDEDDFKEEQEGIFGSNSPSKNASAKEVAEHIRYFVKYKYGDAA